MTEQTGVVAFLLDLNYRRACMCPKQRPGTVVAFLNPSRQMLG